MAVTTIGKETIDGVDYEVQVSDSGKFLVIFDGDQLTADTKKAVIDKLRTAVRSHKRVEVPVTHVRTRYRGDQEVDEPENLILTGIHGSSRNLLYRVEGKKGRDASGQLSHYDTILRRLTKDEVEEFKRLGKAKRDAEKDLERFISARKIDARAVVTKAARDAAGMPAESEE